MARTRLTAVAKGAQPLLRAPGAVTRPFAASMARPVGRFAVPFACAARHRQYSSGPAKPTPEAKEQWREQLAQAAKQDKTPLYDFHVKHGGKMVMFGGHHMPVQYADLTLVQSHHFTREHASLFDVSHMVQHRLTGPKAADFLERVTPSAVRDMPINSSKLSTFLWPETGGIVDDTMITRTGDEEYRVVSNAGTRDKIFAFFTEQTKDLQKPESEEFWWEVLQGLGLLALQGPKSAAILQELVQPGENIKLDDVYFGNTVFIGLRAQKDGQWVDLPGKAMVSRGGYTGEDGFEISFDARDGSAELLATTLLEQAGPEKLRLAGLGARDSLRLEAGMCLYGHDIDDTTTPVEAALAWIVPKERRRADAGFHGAEVISQQLVLKSKGGRGVDRRRVGLTVQGAPAREGAELYTKDGEKVGVVTSGSPSPTLGHNIAMGYVRDGLHKAGTELDVLVRGKKRGVTVTKMPFVASKYFKGPIPAPA